MADRLEEVVTRLRAFVAEREWGQFHDPKNLSMAVASEAGELLAEYRWLASDASDAWSREPENKWRAAMEAADVGISLLMFCDRIGVDLIEAMNAKIALNAVKYPVAEVRGRHSRPGGEPGGGRVRPEER
jgi:NTP pyrophosphatase (non-canonical NTP hydrolase)